MAQALKTIFLPSCLLFIIMKVKALVNFHLFWPLKVFSVSSKVTLNRGVMLFFNTLLLIIYAQVDYNRFLSINRFQIVFSTQIYINV